MKKVKVLGLAVLLMGLLSGCKKFTSEESAISVNNKGAVEAFVKESFDKDYYDVEELEASIDHAILEYNESKGSENIEKKEFEVKDKNAELTMKYASGNDYAAFNDVTMFTGDVLGAYNAGYDFAGSFQSVEKGQVASTNVTGRDILSSYNYGIVILNEAMVVNVPANIVYASDNVEVTGKRTARVLSGTELSEKVSGTGAETDSGGVLSIAPVSSSAVKTNTEGNTAKLAYILYE